MYKLAHIYIYIYKYLIIIMIIYISTVYHHATIVLANYDYNDLISMYT